jgi:RNA polymerase sigma-70 factor (ECF subfamily)
VTVADRDERALLAALRRGEDDAYEELVRRYGGRLLAVTRRLLGDEDDARDAVQEAFLSAFKAIDRFEGESLLSTWLHRIAVNHGLMRLRSRRRRPEEKIDDLLPSFREDGHFREPPGPIAELSDEKLVREETRKRVREAIGALPEGYRTVLLLRDIEELDTAEVAELLGMTKNAVKTRLHRARQALHGILAPELLEEGSA